MSTKNKNLDGKSFTNIVREKKLVKSPVERGFSKEKWVSVWKDSAENNEDSDNMLFLAGLIFDELFNKLRARFSTIYSNPPKIKRSDFILGLSALANRNISILTKTSIVNGDLTAITHSNNPMGNLLSADEISTGAVDSIELAIRNAVVKDKNHFDNNNGNMDKFVFLTEDHFLSSIYGAYDGYWKALLWGGV